MSDDESTRPIDIDALRAAAAAKRASMVDSSEVEAEAPVSETTPPGSAPPPSAETGVDLPRGAIEAPAVIEQGYDPTNPSWSRPKLALDSMTRQLPKGTRPQDLAHVLEHSLGDTHERQLEDYDTQTRLPEMDEVLGEPEDLPTGTHAPAGLPPLASPPLHASGFDDSDVTSITRGLVATSPIDAEPDAPTAHPADFPEVTAMGRLDEGDVRAAFAAAAASEQTAVYRGPIPDAASPSPSSRRPSVERAPISVDVPPPPSSPSIVEIDSAELESVPEIDDFDRTGEAPGLADDMAAVSTSFESMTGTMAGPTTPLARSNDPAFEPPPNDGDSGPLPRFDSIVGTVPGVPSPAPASKLPSFDSVSGSLPRFDMPSLGDEEIAPEDATRIQRPAPAAQRAFAPADPLAPIEDDIGPEDATRVRRPTIPPEEPDVLNVSGEAELIDDGEGMTASFRASSPSADVSLGGPASAPAKSRPVSIRPAPPAYQPPAPIGRGNVPAYAVDPDADEQQLQDEKRFGALLDLYRMRLAEAGTPSARAAVLHKMASVLEELPGKLDEAFDTLVQAFEQRPADDDIVMSLDRVGKRLQRIGEVAERTAKNLHTAAPETKIALLGNLVYWYERCLGRGSEVGRFVSELERLDKTHPVVLRRQSLVAASNGDFKGQKDLLVRALDRTARRDEKVTLHISLAGANAGTPEALKHYETAYAIDPTSIVALQGIERLGREQEKHAQVEWALERQIEIAPTPSERVDAMLKLADVEETKFLRRERAAELLERVVELEPANPTALRGLERCYHALREWPKLARVLRLRAENTYDKKSQVELLQLAAEVYESKLSDTHKAIDTYRDLLLADPAHKRALGDLARLCEKLGDWGSVATYKSKLAELSPSKREASRLLVQLGDFLASPDRDAVAARLQYERAVQVDPSSASAWEALQRHAAASGDERRVMQCLVERARHLDGPRQRAAVLVELATLHDRRSEARQAREAYEAAIKADPTNEAAAAPMLDAYTHEERWADAAPLCELLVNAAIRDKDGEALFTRLRLQTRIAAALGDAEKAMTAALAALDARPDDPDAQADLLAVCSQVRSAKNVVARARPWLTRIAESSDPLPGDALFRLAQVLRELGDVDMAAHTLERALSSEPDHPDALKELSDVYLALGDFPRACKLLVDMARNATSADARFKLLVAAGEIWTTRAQELEKGAAVFEEARRIKPLDPFLLHKLMALYGELNDWARLSHVLEGIIQIQESPDRKAKSVFAMAQVVRDKLHDVAHAADLFEQVLDIDRKRLDAFEELVRLLTEAKDWNRLELSYRKMIARIKDDAEARQLRFALFEQLGLIYRDRLGDAERAFEALEAAARIRPDDTKVRKIVTELLVVTDNLDNAVARTRELATRDPHKASLYAELYDLFLRQHYFDKAWCAVNVLARLEPLTEEQRQFHEDYAPMPLAEVPGQIMEPAWRSHILHADLDPTLTAIFALMTPAVARMRHAQLRPELRVGRPFTPAHSRLHDAIRQTFANAAEILAMRPPDLLVGDPGSPVPFAPALAPFGAILVAGPAVEQRADSLGYVVGKRLAEQRPELAARAFFPSMPDLTALLGAAVRVSRQEGAMDAAGAALDASLAAMMTPEERNGIRSIVMQAAMEGGVVDVKRWLRAADLSSMRAGLLVCGDVEPARKCIMEEPQTAADLSARDKVGELYKFAVSDLYSDLRGAIGIAVQA